MGIPILCDIASVVRPKHVRDVCVQNLQCVEIFHMRGARLGYTLLCDCCSRKLPKNKGTNVNMQKSSFLMPWFTFLCLCLFPYNDLIVSVCLFMSELAQ